MDAASNFVKVNKSNKRLNSKILSSGKQNMSNRGGAPGKLRGSNIFLKKDKEMQEKKEIEEMKRKGMFFFSLEGLPSEKIQSENLGENFFPADLVETVNLVETAT